MTNNSKNSSEEEKAFWNTMSDAAHSKVVFEQMNQGAHKEKEASKEVRFPHLTQ